MEKEEKKYEIQTKAVELDDLKRTNLLWDNYIDYLIETINESKAIKRLDGKPMTAPNGVLDTHVTTRGDHQRNSADIAKKVSKPLDVNFNYIYTSMLMHDAGHSFGAHNGEEFFKALGELYNVQYYHHNAKGIEAILAEDICGKAISRIPGIEKKPELRTALEDEFLYFLDAVISHDGEASRDDNSKQAETGYESIRDAVFTKFTKACSENNYKFVAQMPEGRIAMFADVLSYIATDLRDRFRLGIHENFPEEYLELFGALLRDNKIHKGKNNIQVAEDMIEEIQRQKIVEFQKNIKGDSGNNEYTNELIQRAMLAYHRITSEVENFYTAENIGRAYDIIEEVKNSYRKEKLKELKAKREKEGIKKPKGVDVEANMIESDVSKLERYIGEFTDIRSKVVDEITARMRDALIKDLVNTTQKTGKLQFSENINIVYYEFKKKNYDYLHEVVWNYQVKEQPPAVDKIITLLAQNLKKSGIIGEMFYDSNIRNQVSKMNPDALKYMNIKFNPEKHTKYRQKRELKRFHIDNKRYSSTKTSKCKIRREFFQSAYNFTKDKSCDFAVRYMNTYNAIEDQITKKVYEIFGELDTESIKKRRTNVKYFDLKIEKELNDVKKKIIKKYGPIEKIDSNKQKEIIRDLVEEERNKMEEKMAIQLAMDYVSGMRDSGFMALAVNLGYIDEACLKKGFRGVENNGKPAELSEKMRSERAKVEKALKELEEQEPEYEENADENEAR